MGDDLCMPHRDYVRTQTLFSNHVVFSMCECSRMQIVLSWPLGHGWLDVGLGNWTTNCKFPCNCVTIANWLDVGWLSSLCGYLRYTPSKCSTCYALKDVLRTWIQFGQTTISWPTNFWKCCPLEHVVIFSNLCVTR